MQIWCFAEFAKSQPIDWKVARTKRRRCFRGSHVVETTFILDDQINVHGTDFIFARKGCLKVYYVVVFEQRLIQVNIIIKAGAKIDPEVHEFHNSTSELINGLVSLLSHAQSMPEITQESMEVGEIIVDNDRKIPFELFDCQALLCLHQPENIRLWNPESPLTAMQTFWYIRWGFFK